MTVTKVTYWRVVFVFILYYILYYLDSRHTTEAEGDLHSHTEIQYSKHCYDAILRNIAALEMLQIFFTLLHASCRSQHGSEMVPSSSRLYRRMPTVEECSNVRHESAATCDAGPEQS